jgi:hypothetical protein
MRLLIAVKSCMSDMKMGHPAIRQGWGKHLVNADLRFFVGRSLANMKPDEINLHVPDDYMSLSYKTKAMLAWSVAQGYDYTFMCDNDTFIIPEGLMASGFEQYDYSAEVEHKGYFNGGAGYFMSRKAAEIIAASPVTETAEDYWVGITLGEEVTRKKLTPAKWFSRHFPKEAYGVKRYDVDLPWQKMMEEFHILHQEPRITRSLVVPGTSFSKVFKLSPIDRQ